MSYEITIQDIKNYLASKEENEVIGEPMSGLACLAHNTLVHKYSLEDEQVEALRTTYWVLGQSFNYSRDVKAVVDKFDSIHCEAEEVKKSEFGAFAPELF